LANWIFDHLEYPLPTYDYACNACKKTFEIFHSMKEPAKRLCPGCGKKTLERQLGMGGAIIFKGSGFYQTDYRSEGYKKAADADKAPGSGDAGKKSPEPTPAKSGSGESPAAPASSKSEPAKSQPEPVKSELSKPATADGKPKRSASK
jgi:putative FmdB family regulatory protein